MAQTYQLAWFKWARRLPVCEVRGRAAVIDTRPSTIAIVGVIGIFRQLVVSYTPASSELV